MGPSSDNENGAGGATGLDFAPSLPDGSPSARTSHVSSSATRLRSCNRLFPRNVTALKRALAMETGDKWANR